MRTKWLFYLSLNRGSRPLGRRFNVGFGIRAFRTHAPIYTQIREGPEFFPYCFLSFCGVLYTIKFPLALLAITHFFPFCPASIICGDFVLFTCLLLSYHIFPILSSSSVMSINFPHILLGY